MNRPFHFRMITTFYPPYSFGGDGIYVRRLSNELARHDQRWEKRNQLGRFSIAQLFVPGGDITP
jgi:hypothetical protein